MNKRRLLKNLGVTPLWVSPIVSAVILPQHAQATTMQMCGVPMIYDNPGRFDLIVPDCASSVAVEIAGASGGSNNNRFFREGGLGSLVTDSFTVNPGDSISVFVGEAAADTEAEEFSVGGFGFGRGGDGGEPSAASANDRVGGSGGGGGSAVTLNDNPISVAGGGGGTAGVMTTDRGFGGNGDERGTPQGGGEPGSNGKGGSGGQHQSIGPSAPNGGARDGGNGLIFVGEDGIRPILNHGGGGGGGGFGGGGGGGLFGGGGGGGSLASAKGNIQPGGAARGNGRVVITFL